MEPITPKTVTLKIVVGRLTTDTEGACIFGILPQPNAGGPFIPDFAAVKVSP